MTMVDAAALSERAVVEVRGAGARAFLQGLVTCDMTEVAPGAAGCGALLTPQGKILFEFIIMANDSADESFLLDGPRSLAGDLMQRLVFYRLRAKLDIRERPDLAVLAAWGDGGTAPAGHASDPRLAGLGWRAVAAAADVGKAGKAEADWHAHRIALGVAELGPDYPPGEIFPHEANLDQLHGVAFDKGCYVGQEVVSRMQHRGTARQRFIQVAIEGRPPPPGTEVSAGGRRLGIMGSNAAGIGLALLRLDRTAEAMSRAEPLHAGDVFLVPVIPHWARFAFPADAG